MVKTMGDVPFCFIFKEHFDTMDNISQKNEAVFVNFTKHIQHGQLEKGFLFSCFQCRRVD